MINGEKAHILYDGYFRGSKDVAEHFHDGTEIVYICRGSCLTELKGMDSLHGTAGSVCIIPPGIRHAQKKNTADCYTRYVVFAGVSISDQIVQIDVRNDNIIRHWFDDILALSTENALGQAEVLLELLIGRIQKKMEFCSHTRHYPRPLLQAVAFIERRYAENVSVPEIIAASAVSRTYLMKFFMKYFHQSIGRYLTEVRMYYARQLLCMNRDLNVNEIARQTGFANPDYFCRKFKGLYGITPLAYRNYPSRYTKASENYHHRFLPLSLQQ